MRKTPNSIEGFAKYALDPEGYHKDVYERGVTTSGLWFFARNAAMWDLGYNEFAKNPNNEANNLTRIQEAVDEITQRFDDIIITEHMDEGLILLADKLCWSIDDVIEFRQNIELNKDDMSLVTEEGRRKLKEFCKADDILYETALNIFYERRKKFGEQKMQEKLHELRSKREDLLRHCVVDNKPFPASELHDKFHAIVNPPGIVIGGWKLKNESDVQWCWVFSFLVTSFHVISNSLHA